MHPKGVEAKYRGRSDRLLWVTQILFAIVLAKGLVLYKDLILHPLAPKDSLAVFGLCVVYLMTLLSWQDFSKTMDINPYVMQTVWDQVRFFADIIIVILYAYMLFAVEYLRDNQAIIWRYVIGFPTIFVLYWISGQARVMVHGYVASRRALIATFVFVFLFLFVRYLCLYETSNSKTLLNYCTVLNCLIGIATYRIVYQYVKKRSKKLKKEGMKIGVDVDGVLGNQIQDVLPIIKQKYGRQLRYQDITDWRLPINGSDIAEIIEEALWDSEYVRKMPVHTNARKGIEKIGPENTVIITTARPEKIDQWTLQWLWSNRIVHDGFVNAKSEGKSVHDLDVLIDDYIRNIKEFLENSGGEAILFEQPWNHDLGELDAWQGSGRLHIAKDWDDIVWKITKIRDRKAGRP